MSETIFSHIFGLLFKPEHEREQKTFYLKSFIFLMLIIVLITDLYWDISTHIINLFSDSTMSLILNIVEIGLYFFSTLAGLSFAILVVATILYIIFDQFTDKLETINYFRSMTSGSQFRLSYSIEDIIILLLTAKIFSEPIFNEYKAIFSEAVWIILCIIFVLQFFLDSSKGVLNRFFVLWPRTDNVNSKE